MRQYISARDKWKPKTVKFLIIGESPPASGGYFYFEQATGKGGLFIETIKALQMIREDKSLPRSFDKKLLLEKFQSKGFFVIDVCYRPVNNKPATERKLAIKKEIPRLVDDIKKLNPERIIIVKSNLYVPVRDALEKAGLGEKILNEKPLPFPSHGHQKTYRQILRGLVAK